MGLTITHRTASTELVEAEGVTCAHRRFGRPRAVPLFLARTARL